MSDASPLLDDRTFERIARLMYDTIGLSLNASKKPLVSGRLVSRLRALGLQGFPAYVERIEGEDDPAEFQMAVDLLTTNETYFFREPHHFELFAAEVGARRNGQPISVWSAASSFGDEAYTIAMVLSDLERTGRTAPGWSILGTDISHRVLMAAREGIFPQDRLRHVSPEHLKRYCLRGEGPSEGQVMIQPKLREHVKFGQLNLMAPFDTLGTFDMVFLRNVLIYFDPATKADVCERVIQRLRPGGLLFLGTAEGRPHGREPVESVKPGVFRKPRTGA